MKSVNGKSDEIQEKELPSIIPEGLNNKLHKSNKCNSVEIRYMLMTFDVKTSVRVTDRKSYEIQDLENEQTLCLLSCISEKVLLIDFNFFPKAILNVI